MPSKTPYFTTVLSKVIRDEKIEISIIIATRNRETILWETVRKALNTIENKNAELIIINDGDRSLIIPEEF